MAIDPIKDALITARVGLLLRAPFFGNMATRMELVDATDWCKTAATNGRKIYYNRDFVSKLSTKKIEFLLAHEILHCCLDHISRTGSRIHQLANIAQDYAVNQILIDDHVGERITEVSICQDDKYRGWAWEAIYDDLYSKAEKIDLNELLKQLGEVLDDHIKEEESPGADSNGSKVTLSKEEAQQIRDEIREAMLQAASASAGRTPAAIQRLIKGLVEPKMNWRQVLQQEIQSIVKNDYSFIRPNRKSWHINAILPGMLPETTIDVFIAIDMSGSIGESDAKVFLSEIHGIMGQYEDFKIDVLSFDTEIYNPRTFTQDNSYELLEYVPQGGGGTDFMCFWDYINEKGLQPKKVVVFTDGYPCGAFGPDNAPDTLWIIKGNKNAEPPFGQVVIYENLE